MIISMSKGLLQEETNPDQGTDLGGGGSNDLGFDLEASVREVAASLSEPSGSPEPTDTPAVAPATAVGAPPKSWKKEMHQAWGALAPEVQSYIEQREKEALDGITKYQTEAKYASAYNSIISPYAQLLQGQGFQSVDQALQAVLNTYAQLASGTPEQRGQALQAVAKRFGISQQPAEDVYIDPVTKELLTEVSSLKGTLAQQEQRAAQQLQQEMKSKVDSFCNDPKNEFVAEVSEDVIRMIRTGMDLPEAYQAAIWANPVVREKQLSKITREAGEKALKEAKEKAVQARQVTSVNPPPGADRSSVNGATGSNLLDTAKEAYREIMSRT
jgi:phage gp29-like protein